MKAGRAVIERYRAIKIEAAVVAWKHLQGLNRLCVPRQGRLDGPVCRIEAFESWAAAVDGPGRYERIEVLS